MADSLEEAIAEHVAAQAPAPPAFEINEELEDAMAAYYELRKTDPALASSPAMDGTRAAVRQYQLAKARDMAGRYQ